MRLSFEAATVFVMCSGCYGGVPAVPVSCSVFLLMFFETAVPFQVSRLWSRTTGMRQRLAHFEVLSL